MPFEAETFDYVYEHYSMCHLSKKDTALAIDEMYRVLIGQFASFYLYVINRSIAEPTCFLR